jgi:enamine deaminase RidA (YjgF/YER057c/UK114 family)
MSWLGDLPNMSRQNISSGSPMEAPIGFSRAVRIGNIIAVAGTAPIGPNGTVGVGDVYAQTKHCIEIMRQAIEAAGASLRDVIRTRIMLVDMSSWQDAARAHGEAFGEIRPTCTFMEIKGFINKEWLVETEADCVIEEQ